MSVYSKNNPCGLDGFAFLEFSGPKTEQLHRQFHQLGFHQHATHISEPITWYQQGDIQIIVNGAQDNQAAQHSKIHGTGACAMGFRVHNAEQAYAHALAKGATPFRETSAAQHELLAIEAIGGSVIYFVDAAHAPFSGHWKISAPSTTEHHGLTVIDHLTHNVYRGNMDRWTQFYQDIFNFTEIRCFNIVGKMTGLFSRALQSPCVKIKIPLNESQDEHSQIEEFLRDYQGEGIQHVAYSTNNIYQTVHELREKSIDFLDVPDSYYEMIQERIPWHQEPVANLQQERILIDGETSPAHGLLLQIFTQNLFGPVFFEIIQRKGNQGFGEGNFQALFEAIEREQIQRGTLNETI